MPDVGGTLACTMDAGSSSSSTASERPEETRRQALEDRLRTRDNQRLESLEAKRLAREETSAEHENVKFFAREFNSSAEAIVKDITDATSGFVEKTTLTSHFDAVGDAIHKLTKYLADSKLFLPTYDLRRSQEKIDSLNEALSGARNALIPKKKFGFKNKSKGKGAGAVTTASAPASSTTTTLSKDDDSINGEASKKLIAAKSTPVLDRDEGDYVIKDTRKQSLHVSQNLDHRVVGLFRLDDCDVLLRGSPSAMHVRHLRRCRVFVDRCENCVFVLACQQLRIHTTIDTSFHIHVTSKAIVEDCSSVSFAPYNLEYPGLNEDYATSGLDKTRNNWSAVDDFNFLAMGSASPNWRVLEESERIVNWMEDVRKIIAESESMVVDNLTIKNGDGDDGS